MDPYDAADAQYRLNGEIFAGRRLSVVLAAESRKKPQEMRQRNRFRYWLSDITDFFFLINKLSVRDLLSELFTGDQQAMEDDEVIMVKILLQ